MTATIPTTREELIDAIVQLGQKELSGHPAMKFANDTIVLQAVRNGTSGYSGEEYLGQWLDRFLRSSLLRISNASMDAVEVEKRDDTWGDRKGEWAGCCGEEEITGFNSAITASKEKRREWCKDK